MYKNVNRLKNGKNLVAKPILKWVKHLLSLALKHPTPALLEFNPRQAGWQCQNDAPHNTLAQDCQQWSFHYWQIVRYFRLLTLDWN